MCVPWWWTRARSSPAPSPAPGLSANSSSSARRTLTTSSKLSVRLLSWTWPKPDSHLGIWANEVWRITLCDVMREPVQSFLLKPTWWCNALRIADNPFCSPQTGVNGLKRAITKAMSHVYDCTYDAETDYWTLVTHLTLLEKVNTFKMGVEKDFITIDGRKAKVPSVHHPFSSCQRD